MTGPRPEGDWRTALLLVLAYVAIFIGVVFGIPALLR